MEDVMWYFARLKQETENMLDFIRISSSLIIQADGLLCKNMFSVKESSTI